MEPTPRRSSARLWISTESGSRRKPTRFPRRRRSGTRQVKSWWCGRTVAANRIESGIKLLETPDCLEAFRIANKCMAEAGRRRLGVMQGKPPGDVKPAWRPFQLAFLLMNLKVDCRAGLR